MYITIAESIQEHAFGENIHAGDIRGKDSWPGSCNDYSGIVIVMDSALDTCFLLRGECASLINFKGAYINLYNTGLLRSRLGGAHADSGTVDQ